MTAHPSVADAPADFGSYPPQDVTFLLRDLSGVALERPLEDREEAIQGGRHYSEMLPVEYVPSAEYSALFATVLAETADRVATAVGTVAEQIHARAAGREVVVVSLARAGTPIGVLVRRWLAARHGQAGTHYSISIIRDRGLDANAVAAICRAHPDAMLQFLDGWTGKGAILRELIAACAASPYADRLDPTLAVLADPGACTPLYGTRDDFLVPSACLNATVSGLVSRTVLNDLIGPEDFHGAKYYRGLAEADVSNVFVDAIAARFEGVADVAEARAAELAADTTPPPWSGLADVDRIQRRYGITDVNLVKPGVGETTRVLLRRVPWKVLVHPDRTAELGHVLLLARDRGVEVVTDPELTYSSCGLIRPLHGFT